MAAAAGDVLRIAFDGGAGAGTFLTFVDSRTDEWLEGHSVLEGADSVELPLDQVGSADLLLVRATGYAPQVLALPRPHRDVVVTWPAVPSIEGRLFLDGEPSAGALSATWSPDGERTRSWVDSFQHRTVVNADADGRFAVRGVPAGRPVTFSVRGTSPVDGGDQTATAGQTLELRLARGKPGFVTGRIVDGGGLRLPDAPDRVVRVRCLLERADGSPLQIPVSGVAVGERFEIPLGEAYRDARSVRVEVLPPVTDRHELLAPPRPLPPGTTTADVGDIAIGSGDRPLRVAVARDGVPCAGVEVTTDGTSLYRTDATGRVQLRISAATPHVVFAGAGVRATCLPLPDDLSELWSVDLPAAAVVAVRVLPPRDGRVAHQPLVEVQGHMAGWDPWTGAYDAMLPRSSVPAQRQTVSDGTVTLQCRVPSHGAVAISDLRGPATELCLRLPGLREPLRAPLEPEARARTEVTLQCPEPTGVVVWTVVDARGDPIPGALVTVGAHGQPSWSVRADGDGRAQLVVFGDGIESVRVAASGFEARALTEPAALRGDRIALHASQREPTAGR